LARCLGFKVFSILIKPLLARLSLNINLQAYTVTALTVTPPFNQFGGTVIMTRRLVITARLVPDGQPFIVHGRDAWALGELVPCGQRGCTPIDNPGPRWSAYVHKLRHEYGLSIETINENHGGLFAGTHARYVLRSQVQIIENGPASDLAMAA
jgi:hypothetical protein